MEMMMIMKKSRHRCCNPSATSFSSASCSSSSRSKHTQYVSSSSHEVQGEGDGVCASCLRERLLALSSSSSSSSFSDICSITASRPPFIATIPDACSSDQTIQRLMLQADRTRQCRSSGSRSFQSINGTVFGGSAPWSQSKAAIRARSGHGAQVANSTLPSRSNAAKDHSSSRAFSSALANQNSADNTSGAEVVSTVKAKRQQTKSFYSLFSSRFRSKASKSKAESENSIKDTVTFEKRVRNEWEEGDAHGIYKFDFFKQQDKDLAVRAQLDDQRGLWKPWATPLRIFSSKSRKTKQLVEDEALAFPSGVSYRPSLAACSAFQKDKSCLSLSSSPLPGRGKLPGQEVFCFSPYTGVNRSWNFYVTPVRPMKRASNERN